jgi:CBS domain-containing protein
MTSEPACCRSTDTLNHATQIMWEHDCGFVPIVDDENRLIGALTDRDTLMASYTQGRRLDEIAIADTMAAQVISVRPDDSIDSAEALMRDNQIRRLPVTDEQGQLQGVLSLNDLATKGAPPSGVARTLAAVCVHRERPLAAQ